MIHSSRYGSDLTGTSVSSGPARGLDRAPAQAEHLAELLRRAGRL